MATSRYQGQIHELQKELMGRYYQELTRAAETGQGRSAWMLISGNPVELVRALDLLPVYPEVNVLQLGVRRQALPLIQKAEELGYSIDNCAYVKADIGLFFSGLKTPFATIPRPALILCNYVGCGVYLQWFEHLAEYTGAPTFNLDIPTVREPSGRILPDDVRYVVKQLEELIGLCERITGRSLDEAKLRQILAWSKETGDLWSEIKGLTKAVPSPFDAFFDAVTLMGPLYCLRGTEDGVAFFREAERELSERARQKIGPLPEERFRIVMEGPPPWPYLRVFRDLFSKWGAVVVASTYSTVGGLWEFGFRHDPNRPLESIAEHMLQYNLTNRSFLQRYEQIKQYIDEWGADALVIHSVKSCRLFSAGQGDMREYFSKELGVPTLLVESDLEDPRYFSEAQMRNRIDAFFEALEHKKLVRA
ncbi:MAG: 2-hydroxyacyl-CoA dehydratase subunit D [Candidatus Methylomirabilia bacterium]